MTGHCLVVGAVNVDVLGNVERLAGPDEAIEMENGRLAPGGHAGNCALALSRLGVRSALYAAVGVDPLAEIALRPHHAAGVDTGNVARLPHLPTGLAVLPILPDGDRALYVVPGANSALPVGQLPAACSRATAVVVFDPPWAALTAIERVMKDAFLIFAPGGVLSATADRRLRSFLTASTHIILNQPESRLLTGIDEPAIAASSLAATTNAVVVVTVGSGGCWYAIPGEPAQAVPAPRVATQDSSGAGDAYIAGFTASLLDGAAVHEAAMFGCAVGALATREVGASASLPDRDEVADLIAGTKVQGGADASHRG